MPLNMTPTLYLHIQCRLNLSFPKIHIINHWSDITGYLVNFKCYIVFQTYSIFVYDMEDYILVSAKRSFWYVSHKRYPTSKIK